MNQYNIKKKFNISLRRYYSSDSNSNDIARLVGFPKDIFVQYINNQLVNSMQSHNYGLIWCIDHIIPIELFNLNDPEDLQICYHHTNLIPMLNEDNRLKGASIHFSKILIENRLNIISVYHTLDQINILNKLLDICNKEIENRWNKYIQ